MPASVTHLLNDLEARLEQAHAELKALRAENRRLKHLEHASLTAEPSVPATPETAAEDVAERQAVAGSQETLKEEKEEGLKDMDVNATATGHSAPAATEPEHKPEHEPEPVDETSAPEAPSPQALLKQWYVRYPQAFLTGHTSPLKVGIHQDLARQEPWSNRLIRRALAHYVNLPRYVKALREGAERIDLDGNPAGVVDATAAQTATEKRRRQASHKAGSQEGSGSGGVKKKGSGRKHNGKGDAGKPRYPQKKDAKQRHTPSGRDNSGTEQSRNAQQSSSQSMEDKLASLQQRFGRGDR